MKTDVRSKGIGTGLLALLEVCHGTGVNGWVYSSIRKKKLGNIRY